MARRFGNGLRASVWATVLGSVVAISAGCASETTRPVSVRQSWVGTRLPSVAFVVTCTASHAAPDDPLVHPGRPGASHEHVFFGNTTTDARSKPESLLKGSTTCNDPDDLAAYWTPSLSGNDLRAYYDLGDADQGSVEPYPLGLAGIAGSPAVRVPGANVVAFRCGRPSDGPDVAGWKSQPPNGCRAGTVVRYSFGQCATDDRLRSCVAGEAARFPRLRLLIDWRGDPGMGPHADFWNAWRPERLNELIAICVRGERETNLAIKECGLPGTGPA